MLCRASRASNWAISGFTGGGGGFSTVSEAEELTVRPSESVQLAVTETAPVVPAVSRVAVLPEPESLPLPAFQFETVTGTPSGLVQLQVMLEEVPAWTTAGFAEQLMVGGFFGGFFTAKLALQLATLFFFSLASVAVAFTV